MQTTYVAIANEVNVKTPSKPETLLNSHSTLINNQPKSLYPTKTNRLKKPSKKKLKKLLQKLNQT